MLQRSRAAGLLSSLLPEVLYARAFNRSSSITAGLSLALKNAKSVASPWVAGSVAGRSQASRRSKAAKSEPGAKVRNQKSSQHSGERFKARNTGGAHGAMRMPKHFKLLSVLLHMPSSPCFLLRAGGDVKGQSRTEPYAYWPLDRNMLNRRNNKSKAATKGLEKVIAAAKHGALKGRKAKRAKNA